VSVGSQQLELYVKWQPEGRDKFGEFGWPWELWPWPPSAGCSNTGQPATMWLDGEHPASSAYEGCSGEYEGALQVVTEAQGLDLCGEACVLVRPRGRWGVQGLLMGHLSDTTST
jgi:hypothetical protein